MKLRSLALALCLSLPCHSMLALAANHSQVSAVADQAYLRFPALSGDTLVFTAEGDLWRSSISGGMAQRITSHQSEESRAAISPDGSQVAFIASYEGPAEVYVMPLQGGLPKRVSFENTGSTVLGWSAQGEVLYSTQAQIGPNSQIVIKRVNPQNMQRSTLPLLDATDASLDDTGKTVYFTRMGHHLRAENVRRYRGGAHAQLWRFSLDGKQEAERLSPKHAFVDKQAMWWQGRIYFISDRDGSDNLWSMLPDGSDARQLTQERAWDVRNASLNQGRIVYQLGADLHLFDIARQSSKKIEVRLQSDFDQQRERVLKRAIDYVGSTNLASKGERLVLTARGQIIVAGLPPLRRIQIALPPASRATQAMLSVDGKAVYAICDATGEQEIWRFPLDGSPGVALTKDGKGQRVRMELSPDGKKLVHLTKNGQLWLLDTSSGSNQLIDQGHGRDYEDLAFSPDSNLLAIVRAGKRNAREQVWLMDLSQRKMVPITSDKYLSSSPSFSPDGKWLYLLSNRHFSSLNSSPWGDRKMGPHFDHRTQIYAYALKAGTRFPFQVRSELDTPPSLSSPAKPNQAAEQKVEPKVDWQGLSERVFQVPVPAGNLRDLANDGKLLYWLEYEASNPARANLKTLAIDNKGQASDTFLAEVNQFSLSHDGKKIFVRKFVKDGVGDMLILDAGAKAGPDLAKASLALQDLQLLIQPRQEWRQMFDDAWRTHRDYLFDPNMRGVDWLAMRQKYTPLLARVNDKYELNDLLGLMMAEVGTLHSQIVQGEVRRADDGSAPAFLGGVLEKWQQGTLSGYQIKHIYRTETELPSERGPLSQAGNDIQEGDVITAINGKKLADVVDISLLLRNQAGQQVLLDYFRPSGAQIQAKRAIVTPVSLARNAALRYGDWEMARMNKVEQASQGRFGYLHLRAMTGEDLNTFAREFYNNIDKDGLIIDVRRNGGGNIDSWIIEKLLRRTWAYWKPRDGQGETNMQQSFRGHLVVLADELSYSDGETFAAGIKSLGLGPVIGKRTAGAGVWLSDSNSLIDKGRARVAETGQFDLASGAWIIEGQGVTPDIEVENLPHASFKGEDAQLDAAIGWLQQKLKTHAIKPIQTQPLPAKNP